MNSPYQSYRKTQENNGPPANLNELLLNVANQFVPQGMNAEQYVRQLVQSGRMPQSLFNKYAAVADQWTGRKR